MSSSTGKVRTRSRLGCLTCRRRKKKCDEESFPVCLNCKGKSLTCEWSHQTYELHKKLRQIRYYENDEKRNKSNDFTFESKKLETSKLKISTKDTTSTEQEDVLSYQPRQEYSYAPLDSIEYPIKFEGKAIEQNLSYQVGPQLSSNTLSSRHDELTNPPISIANQDKSKMKQNRYFLKRIALQQDCVSNEDEKGLLRQNMISQPDSSQGKIMYSKFDDTSIGIESVSSSSSFMSNSSLSMQNTYISPLDASLPLKSDDIVIAVPDLPLSRHSLS